jgi:hypothetical protein
MNNKKIIKKILLEVAGISFEVRKWAQIIERYVDDYVSVERKKLKDQKQTEKPKSKYKDDDDLYYGLNQAGIDFLKGNKEKEEEEKEFSTEYTHFESHGGEKYDSALIYGQELYINPDIFEDFLGIENVVRSKLFEVELDGEGEFSIDTVGSSFPDQYLDGILEMILDHMVMGKAFYNEKYEEVFAVTDDEMEFSQYQYYMNENNSWSYSGQYSYTPEPKIDKIEINGKDFPDAYEDFKVDKWVITSSNRIEYDHWKSGYDENGQYIVYLNMPMSTIGGSALIHEIKHAYDDWNRMSKGAPPIRDTWEIKNIYTPDFEKLVLGGAYKLSPMLVPVIKFYYLGSKLETPAYLENEYDVSFDSYRDSAKKMMNFKASNFLNKEGQPAKGLQESWSTLITDYDIPLFRKFKNVIDFLNYTERYFNKRGRDIVKRIDKMRYVHNRPVKKYEPKVYSATTQSNVTRPVYSFDDKNVNYQTLNSEIDKLEDEWDKLYEEYLIDKDPEKRKKLDELDKIINQKLGKLNNTNYGDLPF